MQKSLHTEGSLGLLVGVVGHRHLVEGAEPILRERVSQLLSCFKHDAGHFVPISILTSLAMGADQLVAQVALEMGLSVIAVLPRSADNLERQNGEAAAAIRRILQHPLTTALDLSKLLDAQAAIEHAASQPDKRDALEYEQAGLVIAQHAHVMLALVQPSIILAQMEPAKWPDVPIGGSHRVVTFWTTGDLEGGVVGSSPLVPLGRLLRPSPTGPLIHIATPCAGSVLSEKTELGKVEVIGGGGSQQGMNQIADLFGRHSKTFLWLGGTNSPVPNTTRLSHQRISSVLERFASFNQRSWPSGRRTESWVKKSSDDLLADDTLDLLAGASTDAANQRITAQQSRALFARFDSLANRLEVKVRRTAIFILATIPISVMAFGMFAGITTSWLMLIFYVSCFTVATTWHWLSRTTDRQLWYLDCRQLGEAARVQFFWGLSGTAHSIVNEHRYSVVAENAWLYAGCKNIGIAGLIFSQYGEAQDFVITHWLGEENGGGSATQNRFSYSRWYATSADNAKRMLRFVKRLRLFFFSASYITAALLAAALAFDQSSTPSFAVAIAAVLVPTLAAFGGVAGTWGEWNALQQHVEEYSRMAIITHRARILSRVVGPNEKHRRTQILLAIGREAMAEGARWLRVHRGQPIHPVPSS